MESWGSTLENIYKKKHAIKDGGSLDDVGTVDRLAFIRLNGPPPSMLKNVALHRDALTLMYNGDYSTKFIHTASHLKKVTSQTRCKIAISKGRLHTSLLPLKALIN